MDRLAERGIVFTNAHAPAVVCNPSRTATMTGLLPSTSGVYLNTDWRTLPQFQDIRTIPRFFRDAGYSTFGAGKLFHAVTTTAPGYFGYNDTTAWDAFYPSLDRQLPDEITPHERPANGSPFDPSFDWSPVSADDRAHGRWPSGCLVSRAHSQSRFRTTLQRDWHLQSTLSVVRCAQPLWRGPAN